MGVSSDSKAWMIQKLAAKLTKPAAGLVYAGQDLPDPEWISADTEAGPVRVAVYRPEGVTNPPVHLNFHGGGFIMRAPEQDDHLCRHLAAELGAVVLNVDYDVAPQARFPVAPTQAIATAWWATMAGRKLGWDGKRVSLGGQSAGGNLALGACLELPARIGFKPRAVAAVYPVLDLATDPGDKPARIANPLVTPALSRTFNDAYVPDRAARAAPLASPLLAPDLASFPPTLMALAEHDTLRAEGEAFASRLRDAGRGVTLHIEPGVDHGYVQAGPAPALTGTLDAIVRFLGAWL